MANNSVVDIWFYVNPETGEVTNAFCWFPLGVSVREDKNWKFTRREKAGIDSAPLNSYDVYEFDWAKDEVDVDDNFDESDYDLSTPQVLKDFDNGTLNLDELKKFAHLITGPSYVTPTK
jgi:hypothetical protein